MADNIQELNALVKDFIKYAEGGSIVERSNKHKPKAI
jgi:hypothetical protein